jgi:hypothetical protein
MVQTSTAPINNQLGKEICKTMLAIGTTARRRGVEAVIIRGGKNEWEDEVESGSDEYEVDKRQIMAPPPPSMGQSLRIKVN